MKCTPSIYGLKVSTAKRNAKHSRFVAVNFLSGLDNDVEAYGIPDKYGVKVHYNAQLHLQVNAVERVKRVITTKIIEIVTKKVSRLDVH